MSSEGDEEESNLHSKADRFHKHYRSDDRSFRHRECIFVVVHNRQEICDVDDDIEVLKDAAHNSSHNLVFVDILKNLWRAGASTVRRRLQEGDTRSSQSVGLRESAGASKKQTDELSSELVLEMRDLTESSEVHKSAHQYLKWHACRKRPRGQHSYFR